MSKKTLPAKALMVVIMLWLLAGCAASQPASRKNEAGAAATATRDGSSYASAIVINSNSEMDGIAQEYRWLEKHYPGYQRGSQSLLFNEGRYFDLLEFTDADGKSHSIYFDITSFYGKM